jgi:hypothetical protein
MIAEHFINTHPFPKNGKEINNQLVRDIQDPCKKQFKDHNLKLLFENNARLIYLVYHQYNYNQDLGSIMSFVYEGLIKASESFDFNVGMPFYNYAMQRIRGLLQNWYNYHHTLIHVPVMRRKDDDDYSFDYTEIDDYVEHQHCDDINAVVPSDDNLSDELNQLIIEFKNHPNTSRQALDELKVFQLYRKSTLREVSDYTGYNTIKVKQMIDRTSDRLRRFNEKINTGLIYDSN